VSPVLAELAMLVQAADAAAGEGAVHSAAEERFKLFGAYSLSDPWFLVLIPLAILAVVWGRTRFGRDRGRVGVIAVGTDGAGSTGGGAPRRSFAQRLAWLPAALQLMALVLIAIALSRPLRGSVEYSSETEGVDIALLIDRSGSMDSKDMDPKRSRLDIIKQVVAEFATRRMTDREGAADNIALIVFAAFPKLLCPFTLDVDAVTGFLKDLTPVKNRAEDGTALGVGLAKAVSVLKATDAKTKVVVLLTDGENNIDTITPLVAADLAAREKVRVYTIFAGRFEYVIDFFGNPQPSNREIDTSELQEIAKRTGGRFYKARDKAELEDIYKKIEELERTKRETKRFSETFDLYPRFLLPGVLCYLAAWLFASTWARRIA
jgi:Ca-activated chloride channel family protein